MYIVWPSLSLRACVSVCTSVFSVGWPSEGTVLMDLILKWPVMPAYYRSRNETQPPTDCISPPNDDSATTIGCCNRCQPLASNKL